MSVSNTTPTKVEQLSAHITAIHTQLIEGKYVLTDSDSVQLQVEKLKNLLDLYFFCLPNSEQANRISEQIQEIFSISVKEDVDENGKGLGTYSTVTDPLEITYNMLSYLQSVYKEKEEFVPSEQNIADVHSFTRSALAYSLCSPPNSYLANSLSKYISRAGLQVFGSNDPEASEANKYANVLFNMIDFKFANPVTYTYNGAEKKGKIEEKTGILSHHRHITEKKAGGISTTVNEYSPEFYGFIQHLLENANAGADYTFAKYKTRDSKIYFQDTARDLLASLFTSSAAFVQSKEKSIDASETKMYTGQIRAYRALGNYLHLDDEEQKGIVRRFSDILFSEFVVEEVEELFVKAGLGIGTFEDIQKWETTVLQVLGMEAPSAVATATQEEKKEENKTEDGVVRAKERLKLLQDDIAKQRADPKTLLNTVLYKERNESDLDFEEKDQSSGFSLFMRQMLHLQKIYKDYTAAFGELNQLKKQGKLGESEWEVVQRDSVDFLGKEVLPPAVFDNMSKYLKKIYDSQIHAEQAYSRMFETIRMLSKENAAFGSEMRQIEELQQNSLIQPKSKESMELELEHLKTTATVDKWLDMERVNKLMALGTRLYGFAQNQKRYKGAAQLLYARIIREMGSATTSNNSIPTTVQNSPAVQAAAAEAVKQKDEELAEKEKKIVEDAKQILEKEKKLERDVEELKRAASTAPTLTSSSTPDVPPGTEVAITPIQQSVAQGAGLFGSMLGGIKSALSKVVSTASKAKQDIDSEKKRAEETEKEKKKAPAQTTTHTVFRSSGSVSIPDPIKAPVTSILEPIVDQVVSSVVSPSVRNTIRSTSISKEIPTATAPTLVSTQKTKLKAMAEKEVEKEEWESVGEKLAKEEDAVKLLTIQYTYKHIESSCPTLVDVNHSFLECLFSPGDFVHTSQLKVLANIKKEMESNHDSALFQQIKEDPRMFASALGILNTGGTGRSILEYPHNYFHLIQTQHPSLRDFQLTAQEIRGVRASIAVIYPRMMSALMEEMGIDKVAVRDIFLKEILQFVPSANCIHGETDINHALFTLIYLRCMAQFTLRELNGIRGGNFGQSYGLHQMEKDETTGEYTNTKRKADPKTIQINTFKVLVVHRYFRDTLKWCVLASLRVYFGVDSQIDHEENITLFEAPWDLVDDQTGDLLADSPDPSLDNPKDRSKAMMLVFIRSYMHYNVNHGSTILNKVIGRHPYITKVNHLTHDLIDMDTFPFDEAQLRQKGYLSMQSFTSSAEEDTDEYWEEKARYEDFRAEIAEFSPNASSSSFSTEEEEEEDTEEKLEKRMAKDLIEGRRKGKNLMESIQNAEVKELVKDIEKEEEKAMKEEIEEEEENEGNEGENIPTGVTTSSPRSFVPTEEEELQV